ncbi:dimer_Tnp_hAT domain-containing protein [Trichonephila clavipes]|nr:dimer_Tnp_hAT domain-containing protein [Trichonephila clavipes]
MVREGWTFDPGPPLKNSQPKQQSKAATVASNKVAHLLAKKKKPFIDAEIMKEAMLVAVDSLFDDFKNKTEILGAINMLQLSARTATSRIELIASNLEAKLAKHVETCGFFSIQLDESTDAVDTAQLAISVKMVENENTEFKDLLLHTEVRWLTRGKVLECFINFLPQVKEFVTSLDKRGLRRIGK